MYKRNVYKKVRGLSEAQDVSAVTREGASVAASVIGVWRRPASVLKMSTNDSSLSIETGI